MEPTTAGQATLKRVVIGDNLCGNDGADTFVLARGDGVDLIWDFQAGRDTVEVKGYTLADLDAFTFVTRVEKAGRDGRHALDAGTHEKLAVILDASGDTIVFNDLGDRSSTAAALRFQDGTTISVRDMLARAAQPVPGAPVAGDEVSAAIRIVQSWCGGFQGEVTVTANRAVCTTWTMLAGTRRSRPGRPPPSASPPRPGGAGVLSTAQILDGVWIG